MEFVLDKNGIQEVSCCMNYSTNNEGTYIYLHLNGQIAHKWFYTGGKKEGIQKDGVMEVKYSMNDFMRMVKCNEYRKGGMRVVDRR